MPLFPPAGPEAVSYFGMIYIFPFVSYDKSVWCGGLANRPNRPLQNFAGAGKGTCIARGRAVYNGSTQNGAKPYHKGAAAPLFRRVTLRGRPQPEALPAPKSCARISPG